MMCYLLLPFLSSFSFFPSFPPSILFHLPSPLQMLYYPFLSFLSHLCYLPSLTLLCFPFIPFHKCPTVCFCLSFPFSAIFLPYCYFISPSFPFTDALLLYLLVPFLSFLCYFPSLPLYCFTFLPFHRCSTIRFCLSFPFSAILFPSFCLVSPSFPPQLLSVFPFFSFLVSSFLYLFSHFALFSSETLFSFAFLCLLFYLLPFSFILPTEDTYSSFFSFRLI
jgi:hypothetical protein